MPLGLPPSKAPNCLACRHFIVTWEPDYPRGCEVFGIKSRRLPSAEVFAATGVHCPAFEASTPGPRRGGGSGGAPSPEGDEGMWA